MSRQRSSARAVLEFFQSVLAAFEAMLCYPFPSKGVALNSHRSPWYRHHSGHRPLEDFAEEIRQSFSLPLNAQKMAVMSSEMQAQYRDKLESSDITMLPSYNHTLPTGQEKGTYLALDVGGSTFRVALVELRGREQGKNGLRIVRSHSACINKSIRTLPGLQFFDWIAARIEETLAETPDSQCSSEKPLSVGVSWSFPIEQTSSKAGKVLSMGKGFECSKHTIGQDLGGLIVAACLRRNLHVCVDAIINDGSATLLTRAYTEPSTTLSIILGTGTNASIHMPVSCFGPEKFGSRDLSWHAKAEKVITNTEISLFGRGVLPMTRWDERLNREHPLPDFQPLEYMITGRYLGEIIRLIILEAAETSNLFGGRTPSSLLEPYSLDTALLAILESDDTPLLSNVSAYFEKHHPCVKRPTVTELAFLKGAAGCVSKRAAAYLAISIHALWTLEKEAEQANPAIDASENHGKTTIACDGSVINKYPCFRDNCTQFLADLIEVSSAGPEASQETIILEPTLDATILGAAVAVAICEADS